LYRSAAAGPEHHRSDVTTQTLDDAGPTTGFSHEAYLYTDPARFLEGCLDFIRSGLAAGESVLVAVPEPRATWLRQLLRGEDDVSVVDMASLGANPARIIPEWRSFLDRAVDDGRPVRGIGEPVWAERSPAELAECLLHESLLNLAFDDGPAWRLMCPYDAAALPGRVLDQALSVHPTVADATGCRPSPTYHSVPAARGLRGDPLPPPEATPVELPFTTAELGSVRRLVRRQAVEAGLRGDATDDLVLAVDEVAANSLLHGGGRGVLRIWTEGHSLVCEVADDGVITDPLVGRRQPPLERTGGRGLWLANQLCRLVQIRSGAAGTTVRLHVPLR
jgi:anti-sigma regulatory factor (Ser/Thr protein kinase)